MGLPRSDRFDLHYGPKRPSLWSKVNFFYRCMLAVAAVGALAAFSPTKVMGQQCGSLVFPQQSRLQDVFGPMMNHACYEKQEPMLAVVVLAVLILIIMVCVTIQGGRVRFRRWREARAARRQP